MKYEFFSYFSNKILAASMAAALLLAVFFSATQILVYASETRQQISQDAMELLVMMQEPATEAARHLDPNLARQVVEGLFQKRSVHYAAITLANTPHLYKKSRAKSESRLRILTHHLFDSQSVYSLPLGSQPSPVRLDQKKISHAIPDKQYGTLEIGIDPVYGIETFIHRCINIVAVTVLQASLFGIVLFMIFYCLISRPVARLLQTLEEIDPEGSRDKRFYSPAVHHKDEIGLWVNKVNSLFKATKVYNNQRRVAEAHIERLNHYDMLTELPNRNLFSHKIGQAIIEANHQQTMFVVLCFTLEDFKSVNMLESHRAGDKLLLMLADRLRAELDPTQAIARLDGVVFALTIPDITSHFDAATKAQCLLEIIQRPYEIEGREIQISASIGIAIYPLDADTPEQILKNAESVMLLAKKQGGDRYQFYVEKTVRTIHSHKVLEKQLPHVVENNQLKLVFQPQINLTTDEIQGAEVLARWHHPEQGAISPAKFIPLAEHNQSIIPIGQWVIDNAFHTLKRWHNKGFHHLTVSINVSPVQLNHPNFIETIKNAIENADINPRQVILEITETAIMNSVEKTVELLEKIKGCGVQLAIDDFGTGYSSLNYLKKLPLDKLKIDRSFVEDMLDGKQNRMIVDAIIQLSHRLEMQVVAEGAETLEQAQYLKQQGCDAVQGNYYSQPVPESEFTRLLRRYTPNPNAVSALQHRTPTATPPHPVAQPG